MTGSRGNRVGACATAAGLILGMTAGLSGRDRLQDPPPGKLAFVATSALQALLPAPAGWTKVSGKTEQITISAECGYAYADALYNKDAMRVRVTLADTGAAADSLVALATMVVTLPEGYSEKLKPATTIARSPFKQLPAAERWDAAGLEGEVTVVVAGRFVVKVEGSGFNGVQILYDILEQIDLHTLAGLK